jgi:hypothetical protein
MGGSRRVELLVSVHGFKGSGVQGCIFVHRLHIGCVFTTKASASSGLIQNLEPNWQLFIGTKLFPRLRSEKVAPSGQLSEPKFELQLSNRDRPASGS